MNFSISKQPFTTKSLTVVLSVFTAVFLFANVVHAYGATEYPTTSDWTVGTIVSTGTDGGIVSASSDQANYVGIISAKPADGTVEVANTGTVPVLVSDQDGSISTGTKVGLSSIAGIATAWSDGAVAIGIVQETPASWQNVQLTADDSKGATTTKIASVNVQLITGNTGSSSSSSNIFFAALQKTASGVAGKSVDTWRIITALLIGLGGLILAFGLLFVSSRESFFSMGRNPMAGKIIMRGLWKVVILSVGIMCISLLAAYLIVRIS